MRIRTIAIAASLAAVAPGSMLVANSDAPTPNTSAMSIKEIRIHNAALDAKHPQYILCRRQSVTGYLAKKVRTCLTNEVWAQRADQAREFGVDAINRGNRACSSPGGNPCP